jgi:cupin 2 domain-containing protein
MSNIFDLSKVHFNDGELFETICSLKNVKIERIVSLGHSSPEGFWYDQEEYEWVVLLRGKAKLKFFEDGKEIELNPGDEILIEPHQKHRVEWTDPHSPTLWLAVFFK